MGKLPKSWFSPRAVIDRYFLEERNPYSKRRPVQLMPLAGTLGAVLVIFILGVIFFGSESEKKERGAVPDFQIHAADHASPTNQALTVGQTGMPAGKAQGRGSSFGGGLQGYVSNLSGGRGGGQSGRSRSASQVIRRGAGGNDPGAQLSLGQGIRVRLLNAILSTDTATPVIAEVVEDVYAHGMLTIPATTRAIGSAHYDEASHRIQLRFQTLVYPEGDQHAVQAMGMMPDGSAGLEGDYHSGESKRQAGRFLGHFISGMADGMKERKTGGPYGIAYEPGSIKNGLLNGVTLSSEDQAKTLTEDLGGTKPFMTLPSGQTFVLFLEREYVP